MPLPERVITPVNISRGTLQCSVPDELEGVTNGTLANIIRQLSSLSRHAEEMFGNLFEEAKGIADRSSSLQARIDRLAIRVTQLDSTVEEVSLQDIQLRKAYRSSTTFDQQVVSRDTMPKAMLEAYLACDKPPPLDHLNPYRLDGKDGLKFYTDPNYFFELWRQEMVKDTERMMNDRGKKNPNSKVHINGGPPVSTTAGVLPPVGSGGIPGSNGVLKSDKHKKRPRQPTSTLERQRLKALGQGEVFMSPGNQDGCPEEESPYGSVDRPRPNSIEISRSYSSSSNNTSSTLYQSRGELYARSNSVNTQSPNYADFSRPLHQQQQSSSSNLIPEGGGKSGSGYTYQELKRDGLLVNQLQKQQQIQQQIHHQQQIQLDPRLEESSSPNKKRPTQPPPAPPPEGGSRKDTGLLPLPPPPNAAASSASTHQMLIQEISSSLVVSNGIQSSLEEETQSGEDLPPPPPNQTLLSSGGAKSSTSSLGISLPSTHLPPSPPPPPPLPASSPVKSSSSAAPPPGVPPPPPPPPPANGLSNGEMPRKSSGSPAKPSSTVLSPSGLKKPQPLNRPPQDDVRSDLLKAIRDGIALKKVEARVAEGDTSSDNGTGHIDVASILARRIAVEMSDSDEAHSDSECDSDDWGDESNA